MENSNISWTHNTQNFWVGCDKIAPECAHCYIDREIRKHRDWEKRTGGGLRRPWGEVYLTKTWYDPYRKFQKDLPPGQAKRIFTCSLSDFFHAKVDGRTFKGTGSMASRGGYKIAEQYAGPSERLYKNWLADASVPFKGWWECTWRDAAWQVIRETQNLVYLILTKRPELIASRLPKDWPDAFPNVWLGTSAGTTLPVSLSKMDSLRKIPIVCSQFVYVVVGVNRRCWFDVLLAKLKSRLVIKVDSKRYGIPVRARSVIKRCFQIIGSWRDHKLIAHVVVPIRFELSLQTCAFDFQTQPVAGWYRAGGQPNNGSDRRNDTNAQSSTDAHAD